MTEQQQQHQPKKESISHYKSILTTLLRSAKPFTYNMPMIIDDHAGELFITKKSGSKPFKLSFNYCCSLDGTFEMIDYTDDTVESFWISLDKLLTMKYWNSMLVEEDQFAFQQAMRAYAYGIQNREIEMCYVCRDDSHGFKTECKHDICFKCFMKSIVSQYNEEGDWIRTFKCGLCRQEYNYHE